MTTDSSFDGPYDSAFDILEDEDRVANLKIRSKIANRLYSMIEDNEYSQAAAAERLGVDQSRVSRLLRGQISGFTIDALVNMCHHAGIKVNVMFDPDMTPPTTA
jgi:predicted XRE-type DNA-binding protein